MKKLSFILLMISACGFTHKALAQGNTSKYQALFLYNFTKYMEWPENDEITIGVMGNSQVLLELQTIADRNIKVSVKKLSGNAEVGECDIIFLPSAQTRNFETMQTSIGAKDIILVTEDAKLTEKGAEVGFYLENNKLKFIINKKQIESTKIKVSQALYAIAKVI